MSSAQRVRFTYPTTTGGVLREQEIPFVLGVLADLSGQPRPALEPCINREFEAINRDNFDDVLGGVKPRLLIWVEHKEIELKFGRLEDFGPLGVAAQIAELRPTLDERRHLRPEFGDLDRFIEIDSLISRKLNLLMHAPEFQRLEATWRGLHYLVIQTSTLKNTKIKVLNLSKRDLYMDLLRATEIANSIIFRKVHDDVYGPSGGEPFTALVGDYEFGNGRVDLELLERMARVAAAAHAPFIAAAIPSLFQRATFEAVMKEPPGEYMFGSPDAWSNPPYRVPYSNWRFFRRRPESRYAVLTLPRIRLRAPYRRSKPWTAEFEFDEDASGAFRRFHLWGNAAYAFGARLADSFARYGWCTAIQGAEGGGLVEGLPALRTWIEADGEALDFATETFISDLDDKFSRTGLIPLCIEKMGHGVGCQLGRPVFPKAYSAWHPIKGEFENASAQLRYIFAGARFAQCVKLILRERASSFSSPEECQKALNDWLRQYVVSSPSSEKRSRVRLMGGSHISVSKEPDGYIARLLWSPAFDLPALAVPFEETIRLPQIGAGGFSTVGETPDR